MVLCVFTCLALNCNIFNFKFPKVRGHAYLSFHSLVMMILVILKFYLSYLFESHNNISSGHFSWLSQLFTNDLVSGYNATYVKQVRNSASQAVCESAATSLHFGNSFGSWGNDPELVETVISEWKEGVIWGWGGAEWNQWRKGSN